MSEDERRRHTGIGSGDQPAAGGASEAAGSASEPSPKGTDEAARRGTPVTQRLGQVVVVGIAILFGIFAVVNSQAVDFNWVFGGTEVVERGGQRVSGGVPLIVLLVIAFALGALLGRATTWRRIRRLKRVAGE